MSSADTDSFKFLYHQGYYRNGIIERFIKQCTIGVNCDATGGFCRNNFCICNPGYTGTFCNIAQDQSKGELSGYQFNKSLNFAGGFYYNLHWTPSPSTNSISFALEAKTPGWVALGFSPDGNMVGSEAVIGSVNNGVETILVKKLVAKDVTLITDDNNLALILTAKSCFESNGVTIIKFTRTVAGGTVPFSLTNNHIIASYSTIDAFGKHTDYVKNLGFNFITGSIAASAPSPKDYLKYIHAIIMFVSWAILLPLGGFLARYRPIYPCLPKEKEDDPGCKWWPAHQNIQTSGIIISTIGFIIAIIMNSFDSSHFIPSNIAHATLGTCITGLAIFQFILGLLRPHQPEGYKKGNPDHAKPTCCEALGCMSNSLYTAKRLIWERKHRWLGRSLFTAAAVNISLGILLLFGSNVVAFIILGIYMAYLFGKIITYIVCDTKTKKWPCCKSASESL